MSRAPVRLRGKRTLRLVCAVGACAALAACKSNGVEGGINFERMVIQTKGDAYEASPLFADSMVMRTPPAGTVPYAVSHTVRDPVRGDDAGADRATAAAVRTGRRDGTWVEASPLGYSRALLERGRDRFGVYCSPCHGFDGFASTPIAAAMQLQRPPALVTPTIQQLPDGRIFRVITDGYGLMPSYRYQLVPEDRWAVVAYLRALQLRQGVALDSVAPAERARIRKALEGGGP